MNELVENNQASPGATICRLGSCPRQATNQRPRLSGSTLAGPMVVRAVESGRGGLGAGIHLPFLRLRYSRVVRGRSIVVPLGAQGLLKKMRDRLKYSLEKCPWRSARLPASSADPRETVGAGGREGDGEERGCRGRKEARSRASAVIGRRHRARVRTSTAGASARRGDGVGGWEGGRGRGTDKRAQGDEEVTGSGKWPGANKKAAVE
jgi:hypothetical protein